MTTPSIPSVFSVSDVSCLPPFESLQEERSQILWVLALGDRNELTKCLTASEISDVLRVVFKHSVSRQRVAAILGIERKTVHRSKKGDRLGYQIMKPGLDELETSPATVVFERPEEGFSGIRSVQEIFSSARGAIRLCDPYVDGQTLDLLSDFSQATSIHLLTLNVKQPAAFKRDAALLSRQAGIPIEVRIASDKVLHDRYAIYDDGMLLCGTSLNGLGKKQSFVVALPEGIRESSLAAFRECWTKATVF
jgi:hypothetical protein